MVQKRLKKHIKWAWKLIHPCSCCRYSCIVRCNTAKGINQPYLTLLFKMWRYIWAIFKDLHLQYEPMDWVLSQTVMKYWKMDQHVVGVVHFMGFDFRLCTKVKTYKHVFGRQWFQFRAPEANNPVFSHCDGGAVMGGVDVGDGDAVTQRFHRGWQSEGHLLTASCSFLPLFVLLQHVCAEVALHHITSC